MENLKLLSKIALSFQKMDIFDEDMNNILKEIGNFMDVSRIYIFLNEDEDLINNIFEWCNEGIAPQIQKRQNIKCKDAENFQELIFQKGYISSNNIKEIPDDIIEMLKEKKIKAIVAHSLIIDNKIWGFIGFDECRHRRIWKEDELQILSSLSAIIARAYERKSFQKRIIRSENNFRDFFETIDDIFLVSDMNGNILTCNNFAIEKLGYTDSDFRNMNLIQLHPKETREEAKLFLQQMLNKERKFCPIPFIGKTGDIYSVESRVWIGKWNGKDCIYAISKELSKENENFQMFSKMFENNPLPMSINDIDKKKIIQVNKAFLEKTGYSKDDIIGKNIDEFDLFLDSKKAKAANKEKARGLEVKNEEIFIKRKDGKKLKCLLSIEDITIQEKEAILMVLVDITERDELSKSVEDKLEKLTSVIDGTRLGTWEWNILNGKMKINNHFAHMLGYSLRELEDYNIESSKNFINPEDLELSKATMKKHLNREIDYYDVEMRMKHKEGRWIWVHDRGKVTQRDRDGLAIRMFGTHTDITVKHEQSLELERFFSINLDLLCIIDIKGRFIKTNKAWEEMLGYSSERLKGKKIEEFIHPEDLLNTRNIIEKLKKSGKIDSFINRYLCIDGSYHYIEWKANLYEDIIYAAARDVTDRISYENKILEISNRDTLTNVYNRRYIYDRAKDFIEEYKKTGDEFSICILDIDHFKKINDSYGHQIGDEVLKEFTKIIEKNLRPYDIFGRYGGEEFIIILKSSNIEENTSIMERILDIVKNTTFSFNDIEVSFTFSGGISNCNEVEKEEIMIDNLVSLADGRMYCAKRTGRNKIISNKKD